MRDSVVHASVDAWVEQAHPGKHHASTSRLRLDGAGSAQRRAYIFFARPFPVGSAVIEATLSLNAFGSWGGQVLTIQRVAEHWGEKGINWNNKPAGVGTAVTQSITCGDKDEVDIDVTSIYNSVTFGAGYHGLVLSITASGKRAFYASEHPIHAFRPKLTVEWSQHPEPPHNGTPSGGQVISKAQGRFDYHFGVKGRKAAQRQSAQQVQISTSTDFTSPAYDSGKVDQEATLFDLAEVGGYSVPLGVDRWWRVMAWDENDLSSDWSDRWKFQRVAKGTVAFVEPAGGVINDLTAPMSWTVTGTTQKQASLTLWSQRDNGTWKEQWHWPRRKTDDVSVNIPKGIIKSGKQYRCRVRVWDDEDRAGVSGDPAYIQDEQQFHYVRDGTPDPVDSISVVKFGAGLLVRWHDGTEPDYYTLVVDGNEVFDRIEPEDVRTAAAGGHDYAYSYWRGIHGTEPEIWVERVVNSGGKLRNSQDNPSDSALVEVLGKWLVDDDPTEELALQIVNAEQSDFAIGESGETFFPVGSQRPIRIIDAIRGFEGSVSGILMSTDQADSFWELKNRNKRLRYVVQHFNIPVRLGESSLSPKADAHQFDGWVVAFDLFQAGEYKDIPGVSVDAPDDPDE